MKPKWQKLASLAQKICTLWFEFFGAVFASKRYHFKNIFINNHLPSAETERVKLQKIFLVERKIISIFDIYYKNVKRNGIHFL